MEFDCIVVGAGHAGVEAALLLAKCSRSVALVTSNIDRIGHLSCNPAIGGVAKGHIVKEIDALGGSMALFADYAGIQFRSLNTSKGVAVRSSRAQMDRERYNTIVKETILSNKNIVVWDDMVVALRYASNTAGNNRVQGVITETGRVFTAPYVIITTGTFLDGVIFVGEHSYSAGRMGDRAAQGLAQSLQKIGLHIGRLKTGTPPRIARSSIDFSLLEKQMGDVPPRPFSFRTQDIPQAQVPCYITWTNSVTHEIIRNAIDRSPLFSGKIHGRGARYCPSIEDKVLRFPEKEKHQIFIEPEGYTSFECYPNGISTSLPQDVQEDFVHSIVGFENAVLLRPGYAIEYCYINPIQLHKTLECKCCDGLFLAGQINGTSGYEEAAGQGIWAAYNVLAKLTGKANFILTRDESYIGVLIDDLVTQGTEEPYRMFTSRAEYRLLLRENNADARLTPKAREYGVIDQEHWDAFSQKQQRIDTLVRYCKKTYLHVHDDKAFLCTLPTEFPSQSLTLAQLLCRPEITIQHIYPLFPEEYQFPSSVLEEVETTIKYEGYIQRQKEQVLRFQKLESVAIPEDMSYTAIPGLTNEVIEKLSTIKPTTLGQAYRISGVTPAAIAALEIALKKYHAVL